MGRQEMTEQLVTEYEWQGPKRGVDRAVLLAHGAGSNMHGAALVAVADALAAAKIPSLRFNYPYRTAGRNAPDRPKVLDAATREAAAELAKRTKLAPERLVLGGRSMGGRYCSMVVGDADDPLPALGLVMLSYPLHAAGKPDQPRTAHFPGIRVPILFVSGTRDSMAGKAELTKAAKAVPGKVSFHWVDTADHGYRPLKASGRNAHDVAAEVAATTVAWVAGLDD
jgi:predicted alpha/beta-hydrolase family hydrolase